MSRWVLFDGSMLEVRAVTSIDVESCLFLIVHDEGFSHVQVCPIVAWWLPMGVLVGHNLHCTACALHVYCMCTACALHVPPSQALIHFICAALPMSLHETLVHLVHGRL
jgi:hypothetical protein